MEIIQVSNGETLRAPRWLWAAEAVHRQLRPQLPTDYVGKMTRMLQSGAEMIVAVEDGMLLGLAVYRCYENTFSGVHFYVDDLVVAEQHRTLGIGKALLDHLEEEARMRGAAVIALDSGVQRGGAHKFYYREGYEVVAFNFKKKL